jgi:hypothetical protein
MALRKNAYAGIDVGFRKDKFLPIAVCLRVDGGLEPLPLATRGAPSPPRGMGNPAILNPTSVEGFVNDAKRYLRDVERYFGVEIRRVAIDAPYAPRAAGQPRREAERALDQRHISCITTPDHQEFRLIREKAKAHIAAGLPASRLPHANQLWMLVGFALFDRLRSDWECLEVYPQATVSLLGAAKGHKSGKGAVAIQLAAAARKTGWKDASAERLRNIAYGALHDKLDAYLAAWVASLDASDREYLGVPPDDVIWVPRCAVSEGCK